MNRLYRLCNGSTAGDPTLDPTEPKSVGLTRKLSYGTESVVTMLLRGLIQVGYFPALWTFGRRPSSVPVVPSARLDAWMA